MHHPGRRDAAHRVRPDAPEAVLRPQHEPSLVAGDGPGDGLEGRGLRGDGHRIGPRHPRKAHLGGHPQGHPAAQVQLSDGARQRASVLREAVPGAVRPDQSKVVPGRDGPRPVGAPHRRHHRLLHRPAGKRTPLRPRVGEREPSLLRSHDLAPAASAGKHRPDRRFPESFAPRHALQGRPVDALEIPAGGLVVDPSPAREQPLRGGVGDRLHAPVGPAQHPRLCVEEHHRARRRDPQHGPHWPVGVRDVWHQRVIPETAQRVGPVPAQLLVAPHVERARRIPGNGLGGFPIAGPQVSPPGAVVLLQAVARRNVEQALLALDDVVDLPVPIIGLRGNRPHDRTPDHRVRSLFFGRRGLGRRRANEAHTGPYSPE